MFGHAFFQFSFSTSLSGKENTFGLHTLQEQEQLRDLQTQLNFEQLYKSGLHKRHEDARSACVGLYPVRHLTIDVTRHF